jgi:hypothetical protein
MSAVAEVQVSDPTMLKEGQLLISIFNKKTIISPAA